MNVVLHCFVCAVLQSRDPSTNVVLLEDAAAVLGVIMAAGCMGLTSLTGKQKRMEAFPSSHCSVSSIPFLASSPRVLSLLPEMRGRGRDTKSEDSRQQPFNTMRRPCFKLFLNRSQLNMLCGLCTLRLIFQVTGRRPEERGDKEAPNREMRIAHCSQTSIHHLQGKQSLLSDLFCCPKSCN